MSTKVIRLYSGSGSNGIDLDGPAMEKNHWDGMRATAVRLLRARGRPQAAETLETTPFELFEAHNGFGDEFNVLYWRAPMDTYVRLGALVGDRQGSAVYEDIAKAVSEIIPGYVRFVAVVLNTDEGPSTVRSPNLGITSAVVERALSDAEALISSTGAISGVDRLHTALHGYLRAAADKSSLPCTADADITTLVKVLQKGHPAFAQSTEQTDKIARALAVIVDALNPLRNHQSMAHANVSLLAPAEAMLVINTVRTLLHYIDAKLR